MRIRGWDTEAFLVSVFLAFCTYSCEHDFVYVRIYEQYVDVFTVATTHVKNALLSWYQPFDRFGAPFFPPFLGAYFMRESHEPSSPFALVLFAPLHTAFTTSQVFFFYNGLHVLMQSSPLPRLYRFFHVTKF